jgi:hypothetical protein
VGTVPSTKTKSKLAENRGLPVVRARTSIAWVVAQGRKIVRLPRIKAVKFCEVLFWFFDIALAYLRINLGGVRTK